MKTFNITENDFLEYKRQTPNNRVLLTWKVILDKLDAELRKEAEEKGLTLVPMRVITQNSDYICYRISVLKGSEKLLEAVNSVSES